MLLWYHYTVNVALWPFEVRPLGGHTGNWSWLHAVPATSQRMAQYLYLKSARRFAISLRPILFQKQSHMSTVLNVPRVRFNNYLSLFVSLHGCKYPPMLQLMSTKLSLWKLPQISLSATYLQMFKRDKSQWDAFLALELTKSHSASLLISAQRVFCFFQIQHAPPIKTTSEPFTPVREHFNIQREPLLCVFFPFAGEQNKEPHQKAVPEHFHV